MDILLAKITIIFALSWAVAAVIADWRAKRGVKYYTLESTDGYTYEMAYATRKLAIADAKSLAYSGTAYEKTVGGKRKVSFIW
jgi:hypothetical protein